MTEKKLSLGDVLRENAMKRPAFSSADSVTWELVPEGIRPVRREHVDCAGSAPDFDSPCYNKPAWVIEDFDGFTPTCFKHSGQVLNDLLVKYSDNTDLELHFYPYKGE